MAFGVEKKWARAFEDIYTQTPTWYTGPAVTHFSVGRLSNSLAGFSDRAGTANDVVAPQLERSGSAGRIVGRGRRGRRRRGLLGVARDALARSPRARPHRQVARAVRRAQMMARTPSSAPAMKSSVTSGMVGPQTSDERPTVITAREGPRGPDCRAPWAPPTASWRRRAGPEGRTRAAPPSPLAVPSYAREGSDALRRRALPGQHHEQQEAQISSRRRPPGLSAEERTYRGSLGRSLSWTYPGPSPRGENSSFVTVQGGSASGAAVCTPLSGGASGNRARDAASPSRK